MGKLMFVCDSVSLPILFEVDGGGVAEQGWSRPDCIQRYVVMWCVIKILCFMFGVRCPHAVIRCEFCWDTYWCWKEMMRAQKKQPIVDRFSATYLPVSLVLWYHCQLKFLSLPVNGRIREAVITYSSLYLCWFSKDYSRTCRCEHYGRWLIYLK
jgi:hypothetical protein